MVAAASTLLLGLPLRSAVLGGLALAQVGEFSLVAARAGVSAGLFGCDVFQTVLDTAVLSMLLTPVMFAIGPKLAEWLWSGRRSPGSSAPGSRRRGWFPRTSTTGTSSSSASA